MYLITLTVPHTRRDDLGELIRSQAVAMKHFFANRAALVLWADIGCIGSVRAWEITHGRLSQKDNGWHPHFHILIFCAAGLDLKSIVDRIYTVWANCSRLARLPIPNRRHGVRLDDGSHAATYAAKGLWGLDRELTKGHIKKAKQGETPFQLLQAYAHNEDRRAGALFCEFARTFHGRRQLVWSRGLKRHFAVDELTDPELASRIDDTAELLGSIDLDTWKLILRHDARAEVLELARHGWDPVREFIAALARRP